MKNVLTPETRHFVTVINFLQYRPSYHGFDKNIPHSFLIHHI